MSIETIGGPLSRTDEQNLDDYHQAASVEAGLRREFLARAEKAEAENERLTSENSNYRARLATAENCWKGYQDEAARLRAALLFYANKDNYQLRYSGPDGEAMPCPVVMDCGRRATDTLTSQKSVRVGKDAPGVKFPTYQPEDVDRLYEGNEQ